jgi:hypothetical protein
MREFTRDELEMIILGLRNIFLPGPLERVRRNLHDELEKLHGERYDNEPIQGV